MTLPAISVVLSTLGNYEGLAAVLDSYERQDVSPPDFEIVVARDVADPRPERVAAAAAGRPFATTVVAGAVPGLSANRNAGVAAAKAALVLFTDNDTPASPRLLAEHLAWHHAQPAPEVAVLGHVRWARHLRVTPFMRWLDRGIQFGFGAIEGTDAGWGRFYGANVSVKRELVERVGGFDAERLPYLYEDLDFGLRASRAGLRLLYNARAEVEHDRPMDVEFWRRKIPRLAAAERAFVTIHPEIAPFFFNLFSDALRAPRASGRGVPLISWLPERLPLLGPRAWRSADMYFRQLLAPDYLRAWEEGEAPREPGAPVAPYLLDERPPGP